MNKFFFLTVLVLFPLCSIAQSAADFNKKAETAMTAMKEKEALLHYKSALEKDPNNITALCGAGFICTRIGNRESNATLKKSFFNTARNFADKAVKLNPNNAEAHYVMAVAMGRIALISGSKDKVAASRDIKKHIDKSLALNAQNGKAWNVLGKWNYEVANLNFAERGAANLLFGGIPDGSIKKAIECYEKCASLDPSYVLNYLELGKAYLNNGENAKAKAIWQKGLGMPNKMEGDDVLKKEMQAAINKL